MLYLCNGTGAETHTKNVAATIKPRTLRPRMIFMMNLLQVSPALTRSKRDWLTKPVPLQQVEVFDQLPAPELRRQ